MYFTASVRRASKMAMTTVPMGRFYDLRVMVAWNHCGLSRKIEKSSEAVVAPGRRTYGHNATANEHRMARALGAAHARRARPQDTIMGYP
jgi:hypothetical protein